MSKTVALRTELQRLFKTLTPNVYNEERPNKPAHPCLIYELSEVVHGYGKTTYQLEVNLLDYGDDTAAVEDLGDHLQKTLEKYYFINEEIQFVVYCDGRQTVYEDDKKIIRRRLLFEIQLHERSA